MLAGLTKTMIILLGCENKRSVFKITLSEIIIFPDVLFHIVRYQLFRIY